MKRAYSPSIEFASTEMSCGLRLPRKYRITIIFYSFYKNLLRIYKSLNMAGIMQCDLQWSKLKAKCCCAILVSLCSAVNGSLQCKTGPFCHCSHSQNSTIPLEKAKQSPSRGHSAHTKYTFTLPGQVTVLLVFHLSQTAANISCCRRNTQWTVVE